MINEKVLQRVLDQHAQAIRDCKSVIETVAKNAASEEQLRDVYDVIEVMQRRVDYCEALQNPINYLLQKIDQLERSAPAAKRRLRVTVRAGKDKVQIIRND